MSTRIVLVDDHEMLREGLRTLLEQQPDLTVVGEGSDGRTGVQLAKELSPDIVVMDIRMPDLNGVEATRQLLADNPNVKVIALSAQSDGQMTTEMLSAGASAYVLKEAAFEELASAIRAVMAGKAYLSPAVAGNVVRSYAAGGERPRSAAYATLSAREREVLQLTAEGRSTKEIALQLHVSVKTVETHRRNLMEKVGIDSIAGLTRYAIREGISSL